MYWLHRYLQFCTIIFWTIFFRNYGMRKFTSSLKSSIRLNLQSLATHGWFFMYTVVHSWYHALKLVALCSTTYERTLVIPDQDIWPSFPFLLKYWPSSSQTCIRPPPFYSFDKYLWPPEIYLLKLIFPFGYLLLQQFLMENIRQMSKFDCSTLLSSSLYEEGCFERQQQSRYCSPLEPMVL